MKSIEEKIYEVIKSLGEGVFGKVHIIHAEQLMHTTTEEEISVYRLYHSRGYCLDIKKEAEFEEDNGLIAGYDYSVFQEYDGFKKADLNKIYKELLKLNNEN